jgi:hypothetical protein
MYASVVCSQICTSVNLQQMRAHHEYRVNRLTASMPVVPLNSVSMRS